MTTLSNTVLTTTINPLSTTLTTIGQSSTSVNIGNTTTVVNINKAFVKIVKPKVVVINSQTYSPTIADFFTDGTIFNFIYTSANPSIVNDVITFNLPPPTAEIEGIHFFVRKMRGTFNTSSANFIFNTTPASFIIITATSTTSGYPISTSIQNGAVLRLLVCGFGGIYYWCLV